jgi:hypothetical protein
MLEKMRLRTEYRPWRQSGASGDIWQDFNGEEGSASDMKNDLFSKRTRFDE